MTDIERGARVRVRVDDEMSVVHESGPGWCTIAQPNGPAVSVPAEWVEVVSPPLPPEPPVGTVVRDASGQVWINPVPGHWRAVTGAAAVLTWGDLWGLNGPIDVLVRESEIPRYVPAMSGGRTLWMHTCGNFTAVPVRRCIDGLDPNNPPTEEMRSVVQTCTAGCPKPGAPWELVYVEAGRSDG